MSNDPTNFDSTWPSRATPNVIALHVSIIAIRAGPRHMFDFLYENKECYCFVTSRIGAPPTLHVGQTVRMIGEWSTAVLRVFEAFTVTVLDPP